MDNENSEEVDILKSNIKIMTSNVGTLMNLNLMSLREISAEGDADGERGGFFMGDECWYWWIRRS